MKITPSPRILKMLGQIEFQEWQCLAELIDNSIDAVLESAKDDPGASDTNGAASLIQVLLPSSPEDLRKGTVEVVDQGPGMDRARLQLAVRAGWSGNDQFDRLGLFGMGFNVSTARLGRVTTVLTTRSGDADWIGVKIDLDAIGEDFEAVDISQPKSNLADQGTRIVVSHLDPERAEVLLRKQDAIRARLGHVYSWLLSNTSISIRVNGKLVRPKRLCAWGPDRSVTYGQGTHRETIPAVINIDEKLPDADSCSACGNWQELDKGKCDLCGSTALTMRERRISGWVGVQRYLDQQHFGIDFLRNGRKILMFDKSVFDWIDINNPIATIETEYPVEVPTGQGRIIGEIHLNHVPVHYMKDRFDTSDRSWRSAIEYLRGSGPLKADRARQLNYPTTSNAPIARLFRGYRRNDPGYRCLIPGDGRTAIHQQAAEWGKHFERGDAEYQSDHKWWSAVVFHEAEIEKKNDPPPPPGGNPDLDAALAALTGATETASDVKEGSATPEDYSSSKKDTPKTLHDKVESLKATGKLHPVLTREVHSRSLGESLKILAFETSESPLMHGVNNSHTPIWLHPAAGGTAILFIDPRHEAFTSLGIEVLDLALAQIATFLISRSGVNEKTVAQLMFELRRDCFSDNNIDLAAVQVSSRDLIAVIRTAAIEITSEDPGRVWGLLSNEEINAIENHLALSPKNSGPLSSDDSSFIRYLPALFLVRLFDEWPEVYLDGRIFSQEYSSLASPSARRLAKAKISSLLMDVAMLASLEANTYPLDQLKRTRLSIEILRSVLSI